MDFGRVLGGPRKAKMWFSLRREANFDIFGSCNISWFLNTKKPRFWLRFGGQVGLQKRTCWLQEGKMSGQEEFFGHQKSALKPYRVFWRKGTFVLPRGGGSLRSRPPLAGLHYRPLRDLKPITKRISTLSDTPWARGPANFFQKMAFLGHRTPPISRASKS